MTHEPDPFSTLPERVAKLGMSLTEDQVDVLRRHFLLVLETNLALNLTRVTDPAEAAKRLYLSSYAVVPALAGHGVRLGEMLRYLDLGTGAGFPGVPLVVAAPGLDAVLVDSRGKKVEFLARALREIGLSPRVTALKARGIEMPRTHPDTERAFDLVTARAVAPAAEVVREARRLLAPGGVLAVYKGPELSAEEVREGEKTARDCRLDSLGVTEVAVEDLSPRILLYRRPG
jgi:16S rRNA (guanine527-N7)-methyltransferase